MICPVNTAFLNPATQRRPDSLQEVAAWGTERGDIDASLREFLDSFYLAPQEQREAMLAEVPPATNNPRADAYLGAVAEHLARRYRLRCPQWSNESSRFLHRPFFPAGLESLKATLLKESPSAFRRRMIFVGADPLFRPRRTFQEP
jgi:hypothetical protein